MGGGISFRKHNDEDNTSFIPSHSPIADPLSNHVILLPIESSCSKPLLPPISLNVIISPRREFALLSSIPYTPLGKDASIYCYYCPLCMEFFEYVLRTKCCANYICLKCSIEYLNAKGLVLETVQEIIGNSLLKDIFCPHCFTIGFNPQLVERDDSIRDYSRGVKRDTGPSFNSCPCVAGNTITPLKVGDTFEDLKRKMIPFAIMKSDRPLQYGIAAVETNSGLITPVERHASLNCIFDSLAENTLTVSSPERITQLTCISREGIPDSTAEDAKSSIRSNRPVKVDPRDSQRSVKHERSTSSRVAIPVDFENKDPILSERSELLIAPIPGDVQLESCCHVVASQMMKKIIGDFKVDSNV